MSKLTPITKTRNDIFIPPMSGLDAETLNSSVTIKDENNNSFNLTLSEYLENARGLTNGAALDGHYYTEQVGQVTENNVLRSLATRYVPAESPYSSVKTPFYIASNQDNKYFHFISFEDKTSSMTEASIEQAINTAVQGYTVLGKITSLSSLLSLKILTLGDGSEILMKPSHTVVYVKIETSDGLNMIKKYSAKFLWELVYSQESSDSCIDRMGEVAAQVDTVLQKTTDISNSISSLTYQLDSTQGTVNFLANKIAEQKAQIAAVQSSVSSSATLLGNTIDHIDKEQGSNYIKLDDLSKNVQGLNQSLAQLTVLPSKTDHLLDNDKDVQGAIEDIKFILSSQANETNKDDSYKSDKVITAMTITNLVLQVITLIASRDRRVQDDK